MAKIQSSTRKDGYINGTSKTGIPHNLLFFDTETTPEVHDNNIEYHNLRLGVCTHITLDKHANIMSKQVYVFRSIPEFIRLFTSFLDKKHKLHCFALNVGFDIRVLNLPHVLFYQAFHSTPPIINDRVFIWEVSSMYGKAVFLDVANYGAMSVYQLGKDLNLPKLEVAFDTPDEGELITYCTRDVEITERFILQFITFVHSNNLGEFKDTLASQSLTSWRHSFMQQGINLHNIPAYLNLERDSYHGGRVECFYIGEKHGEVFYNLDINSMYPYVMKSHKLPYNLSGFKVKPTIKEATLLAKEYYLIAQVSLKTDEPVYPVVRNNRLIFPVGNLIATLHDTELRYAIDHNHVENIQYLICYDSDIVFSNYVDFFYQTRQKAKQDGNKSWDYICKIFLNSLYGKFGQTNVEREVLDQKKGEFISRMTVIAPKQGLSGAEINWFGTVYREIKSGEATYSFPAIAGAITANARMLLWSYIRQAGLSNVFYCDTDSLIVNELGYKNLSNRLDNGKLGYLKLQSTAPQFTIRGAKDYDFATESKTKGKSKSAKELTYDSWEQAQFQGFLAWLNAGGNAPPEVKTIIKHRSNLYSKGNVNPVTGNVSPLVLQEW